MTEAEIKSKLEIVRLLSLCRRAASEITVLDEIIKQRYPHASGLKLELLDFLEGSAPGDFVGEYNDLEERRRFLLLELAAITAQRAVQEAQTDDGFEDLEIEVR